VSVGAAPLRRAPTFEMLIARTGSGSVFEPWSLLH